MAGNAAAEKPASQGFKLEETPDSMAVSCHEAGGNSTRHADEESRQRARLMREVQEFCASKQIEDEVRATIRLARKHFTIVGEPELQVVDDPDCGEHYVGIHVQAEGQPEQVFRQSGSFLDSFLDCIELTKQKYINLVYHPTSD